MREDDSCLATASISAKLVFRVKKGLERDDEPREESRGQNFVSFKGEFWLYPQSSKDFKHSITWLDLHFRNILSFCMEIPGGHV